MTWWFLRFFVSFRVFYELQKFTKHHQVICTPKTLSKLAWNHPTVFWLNFDKDRRFLFYTVQALISKLGNFNVSNQSQAAILEKLLANLWRTNSFSPIQRRISLFPGSRFILQLFQFMTHFGRSDVIIVTYFKISVNLYPWFLKVHSGAKVGWASKTKGRFFNNYDVII